MNVSTPRFLGVIAIMAVTLIASADASAPAGRYTMAAGTVYDNKTKLTWQQTVSSTEYSWADAKTYCTGLGASLGGTGWRLPTVKELQTLIDHSQSSPSIDSTAFPATPASWFWSSSPLAGDPSYAWRVEFLIGMTGRSHVSEAYLVRCVR
jgi:hypothetical protein